MFKALGNFLYRTPWCALILLGISVLLLLGIFVTPFHVISLQQRGVDSAQKHASLRLIPVVLASVQADVTATRS